MASTTSFQLPATSQLIGGVAGTSGGTIHDDNFNRRYRSGLSIGIYERGSYHYECRSIFYEVGCRFGRVTEALAYQKVDDDITRIDASVAINPALAANFEGWARKYSNFSSQWKMMNLAGVVERLAKTVACQSIYGGITTQNMRGG